MDNQKSYKNLLKVVYDDNSEQFFNDLNQLIISKYELIELLGFHENIMKERQKAFKLKGSYSARKNPFLLFIDSEGVPVKAFYSEADECTLDNVEKVLDSFIIYKKRN